MSRFERQILRDGETEGHAFFRSRVSPFRAGGFARRAAGMMRTCAKTAKIVEFAGG